MVSSTPRSTPTDGVVEEPIPVGHCEGVPRLNDTFELTLAPIDREAMPDPTTRSVTVRVTGISSAPARADSDRCGGGAHSPAPALLGTVPTVHVERDRLLFDETHGDAVRALLFPDLGAWTIVFIGGDRGRSIEIVLHEELEHLLPGPPATEEASVVRLVEDALREGGHGPTPGLHEPDAVAAWTLVPLG